MVRRTVVLSLVALVPLAATGCGWSLAQSAWPGPPIEPGQRVRVTAPSAGASNLVGSVVALRTDTLVVQDEAQATPLAIPFTSVTRLHLSVNKGRTLEGMAIGLLAGALAGFAVAASVEEPRGFGGPFTGLVAILVGPPVGMLIGGIWGSQIRRNRWEEVPLDRLRVSLGPQRDGLALGISVAF